MKTALIGTAALCLAQGLLCAADSQELQAALNEARELAKKRQFSAALEKHVWYHENSRNTSHTGVRLSFAMRDWKKLADQYPPAKEKLFTLRGQAEQSLLAERGGMNEFMEVVAIDRTFEQEKKSYELFRKLAEQSPATATKCFFAARELLVKQKDYSLYLKFGPNPDQQFLIWEDTWKMDTKRVGSNPVQDKTIQRMHLNEINQLIEVLVGTGQLKKAAEFQKKALELTKDKSLESAVEDAKKRVQEKP